MDPESTQGTTIKRACIVCGREYAGNVTICPEDNTPLTALKQDMDVGAIIGERYEILGILGKGGMGCVYKARHRLMKRIVAIKMLFPNLVSTASTIKRFQQEAQATSTLSHPNILTVHDFGLTADGQPYLVMDFLEGTSLGEVLQEEGSLDTDRFLRIFMQAAAGLAHAHSKGVIHRDIKPSNIMLVNLDDNPDFVKIVDFGIAKMVSADPNEAEPLTRTGEVFGSPLYMSPEQCRGQSLDVRTDIYSLGCVMYRAITGLSPFMGHDQLECMFKQVNEEPAHFNEVCPDLFLPEDLESVIFKSIAKKPEERYQSMSELKQALESLSPELKGKYLTTTQVAPGAEQPTGQSTLVTGSVGETTTPEKKVEDSQSIKTAAGPALTDVENTSGFSQGLAVIEQTPLAAKIGIGVALGILGAVVALSFAHHKPADTTSASTTPQAAQRQTTQTKEGVQLLAPDNSQKTPANTPKTAEEKKFDGLMEQAEKAVASGNYRDGINLAVQAMNVVKDYPSESKPYATSLHYIGYICYLQGQYKQAADFLQSAMHIRREAFGDQSAEVAETKTMLGRAWTALGDLSKAEIILGQALHTREKIFGPNDLYDADTLSAMADLDMRQKKYGNAIQKLKRALDIREIAEGRESIEAATAMNDLANAYLLAGKSDDALSYFNQALKIRLSKLDKDNPMIADSYFGIGEICATHGQKDKARTFYTIALGIEEKSLEPNSPRIQMTKQAIANLDKTAGTARKSARRTKNFNELLAR